MALTTFFSNAVRSLGLLVHIDRLRMHFARWRFRNKNQAFRAAHPHLAIPDEAIIYETFNADITKYYEDGRDVAKWLVETIQSHTDCDTCKILDWGCGPARIVRHLPDLLPRNAEVFGTDFNAYTIDWCQKNISDVAFTCNDLIPPLPFHSNTFDIVYGISVLTHLNEQRNHSWTREIFRIVMPGGLAILTTQGEAFSAKLTPKEKTAFRNNQLVVRGKVAEGRRTFSAFHPEAYMRNLFTEFSILQHTPGRSVGKSLEQDIWILQKSN
ncbi:MAG: class I SAM-dependent methyltransferase [Saprospiraceae bacterium]|nr:class I SAM-dependent methyltransferase [Saprospiraceae bacterium]